MNTSTDYGSIIASPMLTLEAGASARVYFDIIDRVFRVSSYQNGRLVRVFKRYVNGWAGAWEHRPK